MSQTTLAERIRTEWGGRLDSWANPTAHETALCERTWPSDRPARADDAYRQHRCRLDAAHSVGCVCRYCGAKRWTR